mmetsp:Transcript_11992/g.50212  ORF Transcript_11992/g.50212 Transcript_11992/m.50212 type:complete len:251 (+) Transcript_11992:284-1036(+)
MSFFFPAGFTFGFRLRRLVVVCPPPSLRRLLVRLASFVSLSPLSSRSRFFFFDSAAVHRRVDHRRDLLDLRAELLLDAEQVEPVVVGDEVHGDAEVPESPRAPDAVQVRLGVLGEVKVDHDVHALDVDAAGEQVGGHQVAALAVAEVVEHAVAVRLHHLRVDVEARVPELGDLLRQKLDAVHAVAEDDALVDLQLGEERVQAVHFLLLLHKRVVLRDALQRELLHQVDDVRLAQVLVLELLHRDGERRAV